MVKHPQLFDTEILDDIHFKPKQNYVQKQQKNTKITQLNMSSIEVIKITVSSQKIDINWNKWTSFDKDDTCKY